MKARKFLGEAPAEGHTRYNQCVNGIYFMEITHTHYELRTMQKCCFQQQQQLILQTQLLYPRDRFINLTKVILLLSQLPE